MRLFRPLAGDDDDAPALLESALGLATHRVVVKRSRKAPAIAEENRATHWKAIQAASTSIEEVAEGEI